MQCTLRTALPLLAILIAAESRSADFTNPDRGTELLWEQQLLTLTNQYRIDQGLRPLTPDDALTRMAREHSRDMAWQGFISHDEPSGNLKARMDRAGYAYTVARENVACALSVAIAQNLLIESPPHKGNILAEDVSRVGIGIARYQPPFNKQLYITEIFVTPRDAYPPAEVQSLVRERVNELRQQGAGSMIPDPDLERMAWRSVDSLPLPFNREDLRNLLAESVNELGKKGNTGLSRLEIDVQLVRNPKNLGVPALYREGQAGTYGSAVREVTDAQNQSAFLVLTLIGITR